MSVELLVKYPTWNELTVYLTSEEGGKFCVRDYENSALSMIWYKKGQTTLNEKNGWLRSVVWDRVRHRPVCVAPAKATDGYPPLNVELRVEDFLEGVMINAFKDETNTWQLASRSQLGATGKFYSEKSFAEMFKETIPPLDELLDAQKNIGFLSFVLQHPDHRTVAKIETPKVWLIHAGRVAENGALEFVTEDVRSPLGLTFLARPPSWTTTFTTEEDVYNYVMTLAKHWSWQGLTFHDSTGRRWRMRNPSYVYARTLRGNESHIAQRFARVRSEGKINEYLKYYGEEAQAFWALEQLLRKRWAEIYDAYTSVHKAHEKKLADLNPLEKTVVFKLHAYYLANLREKKQAVTYNTVINLVNTLSPFEQARLLV